MSTAAATPSVREAAGALVWLQARLDQQARWASDEFRRVEVESQKAILDLHAPVPTDKWEQMVWKCHAKCAGESWRTSDGLNVVQAPCRHVKLIARPYAGHPNFPQVLRCDDGEVAR